VANLLLNPALWTDGDSNNPPACWDGTKYDFSGDASVFLTGPTPADGDTIAFTLDVTSPASGDPQYSQLLHVDQYNASDHIYDNPLTTSGTSTFTSDALAASDGTIEVVFNPQSVSAYAADFTITPTADTPPAPPTPEKFIIELRTSKDGAHNWTYWRQHDMGAQGNFKDRPVFRKLGFGRRIVMHIRASGDAGRDLVACSVDMEPF